MTEHWNFANPEELLKRLDSQAWANSLAPHDADRIWQAYIFARDVYQDKRRESGEPYLLHALAVAKILVKYHLEAETIVAALLHDVVEDGLVSHQLIQDQFGSEIETLVDGVSRLKLKQYSQQKRDAENLRKLFLAMISDVRVMLIKLAEQLHEVRTLSNYPPNRREEIARQTLDLFSPLAERMGIWEIRAELEDLSFRTLNPQAYNRIAADVKRIQEKHEDILANILQRLQTCLKEAHLPVDRFIITGRPKHIYSIYKKMHTPKYEGKGVERIYDKLGVRIITDTIPECYTVLGIVHSEYPPLPGEFDDYIGMRLPSGYQSLHTAVRYGPRQNDVVEFQIRTRHMHYEAEYGIAAHWMYKEGAKRDTVHEKKVAWLRQMIESLLQNEDDEEDPETFVADLKAELLRDRVYVFTPKGNIVDLPHGATPVDFAYYVHTEVGHRCRGAKVNGKIVPLGYQLKNGDEVEVLTTNQGGPSRDWLNPNLGYIKTSRARTKIRHWFRHQNHEENISQGRQSVERELRRLGVSEVNHEKLALAFDFHKVDDFFAAVGRGDINTAQLVSNVKDMIQPPPDAEAEDEWELQKPRTSAAATTATGIKVQGVGNLLTNLAQCCSPLPGDDDIIGYVTRGRGVTIHRKDCPNMLRLNGENNERVIQVNWGNDTNETYPANIQVEAFDRPGLLRDITAIVANEKINLSSVNMVTKKQDHKATVLATLEVSDIDQLSRILALIAQLPNVHEVRRRANN